MLISTSGIVLHKLNYTDSGIVTQLYTEHFGRQSFFIRGIRKKNSGRQIIHLQPLSVLDIVFNYRETRSMQTMKEFSVQYAPADIHSNIIKSSIAMFLGEVLTSVLKEESSQEELFKYIRDSIIYFDSRKKGYSNFHIAFLAGLCSYLGFEPGKNYSPENQYLDMNNGSFVFFPPSHGNYTRPEVSLVLSRFFSSSWDNMDKISLTGIERNEILEVLLKYYSTHLPSLKKIKSLEVLKGVFN